MWVTFLTWLTQPFQNRKSVSTFMYFDLILLETSFRSLCDVFVLKKPMWVRCLSKFVHIYQNWKFYLNFYSTCFCSGKRNVSNSLSQGRGEPWLFHGYVPWPSGSFPWLRELPPKGEVTLSWRVPQQGFELFKKETSSNLLVATFLLSKNACESLFWH